MIHHRFVPALIFQISQPVGFENLASMSRIAAEAALRSLRDDDPSLIIDGEMVTKGGEFGQDRSAEDAVLSVDFVQALSI